MIERFLDTVSPVDYRILVETLQPEMVKAKRLTTGKQITAVSPWNEIYIIYHHERCFSNTCNHRLKRKCIDSLSIMRQLMTINLSLDRQVRELRHYKQRLQQCDRLTHKGCYASVNRCTLRQPRLKPRILCWQLWRWPLFTSDPSTSPFTVFFSLHNLAQTKVSTSDTERNCAFCRYGLLFKNSTTCLSHSHGFTSCTGELA